MRSKLGYIFISIPLLLVLAAADGTNALWVVGVKDVRAAILLRIGVSLHRCCFFILLFQKIESSFQDLLLTHKTSTKSFI